MGECIFCDKRNIKGMPCSHFYNILDKPIFFCYDCYFLLHGSFKTSSVDKINVDIFNIIKLRLLGLEKTDAVLAVEKNGNKPR